MGVPGSLVRVCVDCALAGGVPVRCATCGADVSAARYRVPARHGLGVWCTNCDVAVRVRDREADERAHWTEPGAGVVPGAEVVPELVPASKRARGRR